MAGFDGEARINELTFDRFQAERPLHRGVFRVAIDEQAVGIGLLNAEQPARFEAALQLPDRLRETPDVMETSFDVDEVERVAGIGQYRRVARDAVDVNQFALHLRRHFR